MNSSKNRRTDLNYSPQSVFFSQYMMLDYTYFMKYR